MMLHNQFSRLFLLLVVAVALTGCSSPAADAQKLLADGKYQEVIDRYPDTQFARRAQGLMAEDLLEQGKYQEVLENYPDTRAAFLAREEQAKTLFNSKDYARVIAEHPNSPLAAEAERVLSDSLYNAGLFDELVAKYPKSVRGKQVTEERAAADLEAAKKLRGEAQTKALEAIMRNYVETNAYKEAASMMSDIRAKNRTK